MPEPILSMVNGLFTYQFHQVAIFCPEGAQQSADHWRSLGYENWIVDHAELKGKMLTSDGDYEDVVTKAVMMFNYDIMPMELEFLEYDGPSRYVGEVELAKKFHVEPFISHMSVYVEDVIWGSHRMMEMLGYPPFHRFITQNHTNPGVAGKKRFIESIFDTRSLLGYDTKLIQKVPDDYPDTAWLDQEFKVR